MSRPKFRKMLLLYAGAPKKEKATEGSCCSLPTSLEVFLRICAALGMKSSILGLGLHLAKCLEFRRIFQIFAQDVCLRCCVEYYGDVRFPGWISERAAKVFFYLSFRPKILPVFPGRSPLILVLTPRSRSAGSCCCFLGMLGHDRPATKARLICCWGIWYVCVFVCFISVFWILSVHKLN